MKGTKTQVKTDEFTTKHQQKEVKSISGKPFFAVFSQEEMLFLPTDVYLNTKINC